MEFSLLVNLADRYDWLAYAGTYKKDGKIHYYAEVVNFTLGVDKTIKSEGVDIMDAVLKCYESFCNHLNENKQL